MSQLHPARSLIKSSDHARFVAQQASCKLHQFSDTDSMLHDDPGQ